MRLRLRTDWDGVLQATSISQARDPAATYRCSHTVTAPYRLCHTALRPETHTNNAPPGCLRQPNRQRKLTQAGMNQQCISGVTGARVELYGHEIDHRPLPLPPSPSQQHP